MTRTQIIAELRRSAAEDADPRYQVAFDAFLPSLRWMITPDLFAAVLRRFTPKQWRMFYLFVAEAMEDE